MSTIDRKKEFNGKLSALNALSNIPKGNINNSFSSVNNQINSTDFLVDLATSLAGAKALKDYVIDTLVYRLPQIEETIKDGLKLELKELCSCNLNPSIPTWFQNGGTGVQLRVTDIDFFDIMKTNPENLEGGLIYTDVPSKTNSSDFNTYLYYTIQNPSTPTNWGLSVLNTNILETKFEEFGTTKNNVVTYTTSSEYSNKKLTDFNNHFIDSLSLFGNPNSLSSSKVVALIIEELFGSISSSVGKSKKQIRLEAEMKETLDCILNSEDDNIPDSFFIFDNPTLAKIDKETNNKRNGIREIKTSEVLNVRIDNTVLGSSLVEINNSTNKLEEVNAVTNSLNRLADTQANFSQNETDKETIKTNFFVEIVKKLQRVVMSAVMTPEFITLFAINHQIIYGQGTNYDGPIDFIKKNRKLVKKIGNIILNTLLNLLLSLVLLYITIKLKQKFIDDQAEKTKNYISILLSLVGVPSSVIAQIRKINTLPIPNFNK
jgi:hypothetical protein